MSEPPFRPDPADMVPPGERAALADTARELVKSNAALATRVQELQDVLDAEQLARQAGQRKHWTAILWAYIVNILHILVTAAAVFFGAGYVQAQGQIDTLVQKLDRSVHSQCGTLNLLIKSYRGAPPPGSPIDPVEYRNSYIDIQRQADGVPCNIPHVVPGT